MKYRFQDFQGLFDSLPLPEVQRFVSSKGWGISANENLDVYTSPTDQDGNRLKFTVPKNVTLPDFRIRLFELFVGLSEYHGTTLDSLINEYEDSQGDPSLVHQTALRIKVDGRSGNTFSIKMKGIEGIIEHIKQVIAHALSAEIDEPKAWRSKPSKKASALAQNFDFCQTERGSFVVTIRTPKEDAQQISFIPEKPTPEIKSILRLAKGLSWITDNDIESSDVELKSSFKEGLNANIAEHLVAMKDALSGSNVNLVFGISETLRKQEKVTHQVFRIEGAVAGKLQRVSELLKTHVEVPVDLEGRIIKHASRDPVQDELTHTIVVETLPNQKAGALFSSKRFTLELTKAQYQKALTAHGDSKTIKISGIFIEGPEGLFLKKASKISF